MSVSEKQTLEIVKVLYRGADILILDEPTAVLTPQETEALFKVMRAMKVTEKALLSLHINYMKSWKFRIELPFCARANTSARLKLQKPMLKAFRI